MPPTVNCCRIGGEIPPGWDVRDPGEIDAVVDDCRIVFMLFYSDNCRECVEVESAYVEVAERYSGNIAFLRVNVDRMTEVAEALGIRGVPSLVLVMDGEVIGYRDGYVDEEELELIAMESLKEAGCTNSSYSLV